MNGPLLVKFIIGLVVLAAALVIAQIWLQLFASALFWKLLVTLVIIGAVISFVIAVKADFTEDKKLKNDKYID